MREHAQMPQKAGLARVADSRDSEMNCHAFVFCMR
jgi:hypothetical protein